MPNLVRGDDRPLTGVKMPCKTNEAVTSLKDPNDFWAVHSSGFERVNFKVGDQQSRCDESCSCSVDGPCGSFSVYASRNDPDAAPSVHAYPLPVSQNALRSSDMLDARIASSHVRARPVVGGSDALNAAVSARGREFSRMASNHSTAHPRHSAPARLNHPGIVDGTI